MQTNVLLFLLGIQILKVIYANNYKITWHKNVDQNKKFLTVTLETNSIIVTNIQKMNEWKSNNEYIFYGLLLWLIFGRSWTFFEPLSKKLDTKKHFRYLKIQKQPREVFCEKKSA